ncbi:MAG TPA: SDR family oxidoreductase [Pirellulaceae bacterium]|nr:SDR family oxidoreductase [Pirellulaceae bacterium]
MNEAAGVRQALVTGGTSGIGQAISLALAASGCRVLATGLSAAEVDRFRATAATGEAVDATTLDISNVADVERVIGSLSSLDVVVNCAGTIRRGGAEHDPAVFAEVINVNLNGTMRVCAAALPLLEKSRGCVLNIASMLSFFGSGFVPAYSASKGGIAQLTKSLAIAWADRGIRVNAVAPGWIETAMTQPLVEDAARRQAILDRTPLGRWGKPEDVAGAALFLCSPAAAFITGAIVPVDGGYSIA